MSPSYKLMTGLGALCLALSSAYGTSNADETLLLRDPDISQNHIAFVYAGDIWLADRDGKNSQRLTSNVADESGPVFSPDGQTIAYTARHNGNTDVYSISIKGGQALRHTFHPGADTAIDWSADGEAIAFVSARERVAGRSQQLFHVDLEGGLPEKQMESRMFRAQYNADGSLIASIPFSPAYNALYGGTSGWRGYRGGRSPSIQILSTADEDWAEISGDRVNDIEPMWAGDDLYFISDRDSDEVFNIYHYDSETDDVEKITQEDLWDIRAAAIHEDVIIFEVGGRLRLFDIETSRVTDLKMTLNPDLPQLKPRWKNVGDNRSSVDISNSGQRVAITARGDVFSVPVKDGTTRNISSSSGVRDYSGMWSPDGQSIAYIEENNRQQFLKIEDQSGIGDLRSFKLGEDFYSLLDWGGKGDDIVYQNNHLEVFLMNVKTGQSRKIAEDARRQFGRAQMEVDTSPDGSWLALTLEQPNFNRDLFLYNLASDKLTQVTNGLADIGAPAFSPDGTLLYFTGSTNSGPTQTGLDMTSQERPYRAAIYAIVLEEEGASPLLPKTGDEPAEDATSKDDEAKSDEKKTVQVALDDIDKRIVALPVSEASYSDLAVAHDGTLYFVKTVQAGTLNPAPGERFQDEAELMRFDSEKRKAEKVIGGVTGLQISDNGKFALLTKANGALEAGEIGKKIEAKPVKTSGMRMKIEPQAEWQQIFDDVWRMEASYFYDPDMHGLDWDAVYKRYQTRVKHVGRREDLNSLMAEMIGEMQVGHNRLGGGDIIREESEQVGLLGADLTIVNGRHRIKHIYTGESWNPFLSAPLSMPGLDVSEGDYILAVNGIALEDGDNIFEHMAGTVGVQTVLSISSSPNGRNARDITVLPVSTERAIRQWAWVESNRKAVEEATDGRVGYVYLPNTGAGGYTFFNRMFFAQTDKEAMIIDERSNGGGQAANYITDVLSRTYLAGWKDRAGLNFNTPGFAMFGPKVMLIDQDAGSGGDFLPYSFRHMEIGKLIGTRTWGGLIGISVNPSLVDGGFLSVPYFRYFDTDGKWTIENEGVAPDIRVELDPIAANDGIDTQLDRAIVEIMEELKTSPSPVPGPTETPDFPTELGK